MKKWFVLALIAAVTVGVQAGEGTEKGKKKGADKPVTKEQYVAQQKKMADKKGSEFDQAKIEARFDKMDKNGDGTLTSDEKPAKKAKKVKKDKASESAE